MSHPRTRPNLDIHLSQEKRYRFMETSVQDFASVFAGLYVVGYRTDVWKIAAIATVAIGAGRMLMD